MDLEAFSIFVENQINIENHVKQKTISKRSSASDYFPRKVDERKSTDQPCGSTTQCFTRHGYDKNSGSDRRQAEETFHAYPGVSQ
jgi:hypothetical protein